MYQLVVRSEGLILNLIRLLVVIITTLAYVYKGVIDEKNVIGDNLCIKCHHFVFLAKQLMITEKELLMS